MRKTLFAMLGLVAIAMWALPALAIPTAGGVVPDVLKVRPEPVALENRAGTSAPWLAASGCRAPL